MEGEQRLRNLKQAIGAACDQFQTDIGKGAADRAVLMKKWGVLYTAVKAAFGGSLSKNAPLWVSAYIISYIFSILNINTIWN